MKKHVTYSVYPRWSSGSPASVSKEMAHKVFQDEMWNYARALEGTYGERLQEQAKQMGLNNIVEEHIIKAHHIEYFDMITGKYGILKEGKRSVVGQRELDVKIPFFRKCPDCGIEFVVDGDYSDEAYKAHKENDPNAVCVPCFDNFDGLTIDQLLDI
jgi:hypothetical protein